MTTNLLDNKIQFLVEQLKETAIQYKDFQLDEDINITIYYFRVHRKYTFPRIKKELDIMYPNFKITESGIKKKFHRFIRKLNKKEN